MKQFFSNRQVLMAEDFMLRDVLIAQYSYEASLKVQRWKYIMKIPGIGLRIREEAIGSIRRSFFCYVSNTRVLLQEGFYYADAEN